MHIYSAVRPLYYSAKFFGLWPHSFKKTPHYWPTLSIVWTLCILTTHVRAIFILNSSWFLDYSVDGTKSSIGKWTQIAQVYLVLSLGILLIVYNLFNHWNLWALNESIALVDDALQKHFHIILDYEYNVRFLTIAGSCGYCMFTILFVLYYLFVCLTNECMDPMFMVAVCWCIYSLLTEIVLALFLLLHVKKKFFSLNCILRQLLIDDPLTNFTIVDVPAFFHVQEIVDVFEKSGKRVKVPSKSKETLRQQRKRARKCNVSKLVLTDQSGLNEVLETITQVLRVYSSVCDCVQLWSKTFAFPFLEILTIGYCNAVGSLFVVVRSYLLDLKGSALILTAFNSTWTTLFSITLFLLLKFTTDTIAEASETGLIINRVLRLAQNDVLADKLLLASEQTHWNHVRLTCGLFAFDWPLVLAAIGSMTNYLLFLLQLKI